MTELAKVFSLQESVWLFCRAAKKSGPSKEVIVFRGGSRGRVQGVRIPPPRDDLRFSNTTGILQKKKTNKLCGLLVLK